MILADPLIIIRAGNANWTPRWFEIWMFKWPELIWSFDDLSYIDKSSITPLEPWRSWKKLIFTRAVGSFTKKEFDLFLKNKQKNTKAFLVTLIPSKVLNFLLIFYLLTKHRKISEQVYYLLISSNCPSFIKNILLRDD